MEKVTTNSHTLGVESAETKKSTNASHTTKSQHSDQRNSSGELLSPVEFKKTVSKKKSPRAEILPQVETAEDLNKILGNTLSAILEENKGSNIVASPLSLYSCFAMIGQGLGEGKSFKELQRVFGFSENTILNDALLKSILKISEAEGVTVKMVSHLYTNKNVKIKSEFVESLKSKYQAHAKSLDFSKPETVDEINEQISSSTDGLVKGALTQLNPTAFSVMVNSIYFKGEWEYPFSEDANFQHPFKKSDGTQVDCTFMAHRNLLASIKVGKEHSNFLALSYVGGDLKLVIEMTKDKALGSHNPEEVLQAAKQTPSMCEVYIPKFKSIFSTDLLPVLKRLGVQRIFAASKDFNKITDHQMCISSIVHNACIQVDERGTEAFCFTMAEEFGEGSSGTALPKFVADRPFFFHLVDVRNKIILFSGTVEEPRF